MRHRSPRQRPQQSRAAARAAFAVAAILSVVSACGSGSTGAPKPSTNPPPTVSSPSGVPTTSAPTSSTSTTSATTKAPTATSAATSGTTIAPTTTPTAPPTTALATPKLDAVAIKLDKIATVSEPIAMAVRPGNASLLYVAERAGRIWAVRNGNVDSSPLLDIRGRTTAGGERGLLGIAISPDGARIYTSYTDTGGTSQLDEYQLDGDGGIDATSRRSVLSQAQPYANHNGGNIVFGPDGYLYLGFGDGGSGGDPERRADKLTTLLGKLLRIDPRPVGDSPYAVPADNPLVGQDGVNTEIWSWGLRNPWRFSFDKANGDLWIGDVGQSTLEEVDWVRAADGGGRGLNFGWSAWEGSKRYNDDVTGDGATPPLHEYAHGDLGCSITGGYVYRGAAIPALQGAYVFGDYCAAGVRAIDPAAPDPSIKLTDGPGQLVSFGQDAAGELYALSFDGNAIYKLVPG